MDYTSRTFTEMWGLIMDCWTEGDFPSPELLIGLFWEETMFQNRRQKAGGPAIGFGQVERQNIPKVNQWASKNYSETLILIYDQASVQITIDLLNMLWSRLPTPRSVLNGYAGVKQRPRNARKVDQWLECESILQNGTIFGSGSTLLGLQSLDRETVIAALKAAEPNHAPAVSAVVDL